MTLCSSFAVFWKLFHPNRTSKSLRQFSHSFPPLPLHCASNDYSLLINKIYFTEGKYFVTDLLSHSHPLSIKITHLLSSARRISVWYIWNYIKTHLKNLQWLPIIPITLIWFLRPWHYVWVWLLFTFLCAQPYSLEPCHLVLQLLKQVPALECYMCSPLHMEKPWHVHLLVIIKVSTQLTCPPDHNGKAATQSPSNTALYFTFLTVTS